MNTAKVDTHGVKPHVARPAAAHTAFALGDAHAQKALRVSLGEDARHRGRGHVAVEDEHFRIARRDRDEALSKGEALRDAFRPRHGLTSTLGCVVALVLQDVHELERLAKRPLVFAQRRRLGGEPGGVVQEQRREELAHDPRHDVAVGAEVRRGSRGAPIRPGRRGRARRPSPRRSGWRGPRRCRAGRQRGRATPPSTLRDRRDEAKVTFVLARLPREPRLREPAGVRCPRVSRPEDVAPGASAATRSSRAHVLASSKVSETRKSRYARHVARRVGSGRSGMVRANVRLVSRRRSSSGSSGAPRLSRRATESKHSRRNSPGRGPRRLRRSRLRRRRKA